MAGTASHSMDLVLTNCAAPRPSINSIALAGLDVMINGIGGSANETYYVLAATNAALPLTNWTRVATNMFDANGNSSFTDTLDVPQRFYLLHLP